MGGTGPHGSVADWWMGRQQVFNVQKYKYTNHTQNTNTAVGKPSFFGGGMGKLSFCIEFFFTSGGFAKFEIFP